MNKCWFYKKIRAVFLGWVYFKIIKKTWNLKMHLSWALEVFKISDFWPVFDFDIFYIILCQFIKCQLIMRMIICSMKDCISKISCSTYNFIYSSAGLIIHENLNLRHAQLDSELLRHKSAVILQKDRYNVYFLPG